MWFPFWKQDFEVVLSSTSFLKGIWSEETGLGAESSLKSQFTKYPVFLLRVLNWNLPAAGRHFHMQLWGWNILASRSTETSLFGLWGSSEVKVGRTERKLCFCLWIKPLACERYQLWVSRDSQMYSVRSRTLRQEQLKFRVVGLLGYVDFRL